MDCPKCSTKMERRKHYKITPKMKEKAYLFSEWDFCLKCKHLQHYNKFKMNYAELYEKLNQNQSSLIKV